MEVNQTTTDVIYLFLLEKELFKLCIHLDITDCEQVLFLSAVSFHVPLNDDSGIVFFLRFVHFHQTQLIHSLYHKYCLFSSSEYLHELSSATDCSPATLKTQNGIHFAFQQITASGKPSPVEGQITISQLRSSMKLKKGQINLVNTYLHNFLNKVEQETTCPLIQWLCLVLPWLSLLPSIWFSKQNTSLFL